MLDVCCAMRDSKYSVIDMLHRIVLESLPVSCCCQICKNTKIIVAWCGHRLSVQMFGKCLFVLNCCLCVIKDTCFVTDVGCLLCDM